MSWQELATNTLTGTATTLDSGTFTAKKYLFVLIFAPSARVWLRVNSDPGANYAYRRSEEGGSDSTGVNKNEIRLDRNSTESFFSYFYIYNEATLEKLFTLLDISNNNNGSGNAPKRQEFAFKWADTSNQITEVNLISSTGNFDIGTTITVMGAD